MSSPQPKPEANLIIGIMYKQKPVDLLIELKGLFGEFKHSDEFNFNFTKFYDEEFGKDLKKIFLKFGRFDIEKLPEVKHKCFELEKASGGKRKYNIDPGYATKNAVVLASFKPRAHRIYLKDKVYADLQLVYENKEWKGFSWTFPDINSHLLKLLK